MPTIWLSLWVPLLSLAWLVPNHYFPWGTFHNDSWIGLVLISASAAVILRSSRAVVWHGFPILIGLIAFLPFLQFSVGMLPFSGQAWVGTIYCFGLLLALLTGARWEDATPGRAADGLFFSIGIAAFISVSLQLHQWLIPDGDDLQVWIAEFSKGRPSANLGQPNQLATLLIWAILATGWGVIRKKIGPIWGIFCALYFLFGVALTQSRIAFIAILVITLLAWLWRELWASKFVPWIISFLCLFFLIFTSCLQYLSDSLYLDVQIRAASLGGGSTELRIKAYKLFLDASLQQPWNGYGWYRLPLAQLNVAQDHPSLTAFFTHSHNLFLDLILWLGFPVGGGISIYLLFWFFKCVMRVSNGEDAILAFFLVAVGLHAMVEFPLHHAYLLLPTGFVIGILNTRQHNRIYFNVSRWAVFFLWAFTLSIFLLIIRDYLRIDESFRQYRLESARIKMQAIDGSPNVIILNDMKEFMVNVRAHIGPDIEEEDLEKLYDITTSFPTTSNLFNYARALAYRHRPEDALTWIKKIQKVVPSGFDRDLQNTWESEARDQPAMAIVKWPPADSSVIRPDTIKNSPKN